MARYDRTNLLSSDVRQRVRELIEAEPGVCLTEVRDRLGIAIGQVVWHKDVLAAHGVIVTRRHNKAGRYYPVALGRAYADHDVALREPSTFAVWEAVRNTPGLPVSHLAARLPFGRQNVSYQLARLRRVGLARSERGPRNARVNYAEPAACGLRADGVGHDDARCFHRGPGARRAVLASRQGIVLPGRAAVAASGACFGRDVHGLGGHTSRGRKCYRYIHKAHKRLRKDSA